MTDSLHICQTLQPLFCSTLKYIEHHRLRTSTSVTKYHVKGAPSLKSIYLDGVSFRHFQPPLAVAATKTLHTENHPFQVATTCEKFCSVLSPSLALTRLTISGSVFGTFWTPDGTLELPSLRFLTIRAQGSLSIIPALPLAICAPNLESMRLETVVNADLEPFFQIVDVSATQKYCSLRSLTIYDSDQNGFTRSEWRDLMHAFPTITHFTLSYRSLGEFLLSLQSRHRVPTSSAMITPWPNLHTLALNDNTLSVGADIGLYLLHQAVLARTVLGHPIRTISLSDLIIDQLRRGGIN
ncbi:hypothetical protein PILCRDRAFT_543751 [Piloderma croceum F 1598]|uniref:F-box domain-containing protein n=1 Tax=Piloderma croceum (strain F 1598) TaxID=765440 RepID=A0A0C3FJL0_PILCF|nr:hypothetical protein PILCRDRAFT_543751 [Piloderma croceum F 1598]